MSDSQNAARYRLIRDGELFGERLFAEVHWLSCGQLPEGAMPGYYGRLGSRWVGPKLDSVLDEVLPADDQREQRAARVKAKVQPGDLITHTRCLGYVEEHTFLRWEGKALCGPGTRETIRHGGDKYANDIAPENVTHINRVPVELL